MIILSIIFWYIVSAFVARYAIKLSYRMYPGFWSPEIFFVCLIPVINLFLIVFVKGQIIWKLFSMFRKALGRILQKVGNPQRKPLERWKSFVSSTKKTLADLGELFIVWYTCIEEPYDVCPLKMTKEELGAMKWRYAADNKYFSDYCMTPEDKDREEVRQMWLDINPPPPTILSNFASKKMHDTWTEKLKRRLGPDNCMYNDAGDPTWVIEVNYHKFLYSIAPGGVSLAAEYDKDWNDSGEEPNTRTSVSYRYFLYMYGFMDKFGKITRKIRVK